MAFFRFPCRLWLCSLAALSLTLHPAPDSAVQSAGMRDYGLPLVTGSVIRDLTHEGPPPMAMPTAVAVSPRGEVFVADGVNDRIVRFDSSGEFAGEIRTVAGMELSRLMSVKVDPAERLWIADTGNGRVVWTSLTSSLERTVRVENTGKERLDITDLAVSADGLTVWLVGNDNHVLLRKDLETGDVRTVGAEGDDPGQFRYPFMITTTTVGDVYVTDVVNGRIVVFGADGAPISTLGTYGLQAGNLYRPGGIALDAAGRVWVSDGVLGSVQVFSPDGQFLGLLREEGGEPLRFDMPMGVAFGPAGDLYVVELKADRVRRVRVMVRSGDPPEVPTAPQDMAAVRQPRICTSCHLTWMYPLVNGEGTEFFRPEDDSLVDPRVSRARTCLSCHNGCTADSRQEVWVSENHPMGATREAGGPGRTTLPVPDGRILCRTCHAAHLRIGPTQVSTAVTLRAKMDPSQLCEECHRGLQGGTARGMHPLPEMKVPLPETLVPPVDWTGGRKINCLVCHRAHGARGKMLLAERETTNELCVGCHRRLSPELFHQSNRSRHGLRPVLSPGQLEVAALYGTRIGPQGELLCTTCHSAHGALLGRSLLAFDPASPHACSSCHPEQKSVIRSTHDLRTNHAKSENVLGVTASEGGACSGCHTGHRYGRDPSPTPLDPKGLCITCHRKGGVASATRLGPVNHPKTPCEKCHDPHEARVKKYLRSLPYALCQGCHESMRQMSGGPHDLNRNPREWPEAAAETRDLCLACHRAHGTEQDGLFRAGLSVVAQPADAACVACHSSSAPGGGGDTSLVHPGQVEGFVGPEGFPLEATDSGQPWIACKTCHDPHRAAGPGSAAAKLLRGSPGRDEAGWELCLSCHAQMAGIGATGHSPQRFAKDRFETTGCQPCHLVHAEPAGVEQPLLYPESLLSKATDSPLNLAADRYCVGCHRPGGRVAPPEVATHPTAPMFNPTPPEHPGFLPLFSTKGEVDPNGSIGCRTCHVTHGRTEPGELPSDSRALSARGERAREWRLRNFGEGNVCSVCHGLDALWRFLYFHDPGARGPTPVRATSTEVEAEFDDTDSPEEKDAQVQSAPPSRQHRQKSQ